MFRIFLTLIVGCMHAYVFIRLLSFPFFKGRRMKDVILSSGVILFLIFLLGRMVGHSGTGFLSRTLEFTGMTWMACLFLVFCPLLVSDILTGFGLVLRPHSWKIRGIALLAGICMSILALILGHLPPVMEKYEVKIRDLPASLEGKKIIGIADLHLGSQLGRRWLEGVVARVMEEKPDMIVLLGDVHEGHGNDPSEFIPVLKELRAGLGKWAVPGNHESHRRSEPFRGLMEKAGFSLLVNRCEEPVPGMVLAGIQDLTSYYRSGQAGDPVADAVASCPEGSLVLLSHTPLDAERASELGVDLMLCGHTHAGQIWPFGYIVRQRYPVFSGRYDIKDMTVIVSRGAGTWGPRMRLWKRGDILSVTLRRG